MQTPFYFLFNTLLLCASFYMSIAQGGEGYIHTFLMCLGAFILGHLVTEALNYVENDDHVENDDQIEEE